MRTQNDTDDCRERTREAFSKNVLEIQIIITNSSTYGSIGADETEKSSTRRTEATPGDFL